MEAERTWGGLFPPTSHPDTIGQGGGVRPGESVPGLHPPLLLRVPTHIPCRGWQARSVGVYPWEGAAVLGKQPCLGSPEVLKASLLGGFPLFHIQIKWPESSSKPSALSLRPRILGVITHVTIPVFTCPLAFWDHCPLPAHHHPGDECHPFPFTPWWIKITVFIANVAQNSGEGRYLELPMEAQVSLFVQMDQSPPHKGNFSLAWVPVWTLASLMFLGLSFPQISHSEPKSLLWSLRS